MRTLRVAATNGLRVEFNLLKAVYRKPRPRLLPPATGLSSIDAAELPNGLLRIVERI
jgi:hypothetical protein